MIQLNKIYVLKIFNKNDIIKISLKLSIIQSNISIFFIFLKLNFHKTINLSYRNGIVLFH